MNAPARPVESFGSYVEAARAFFDEPWSDGLPVTVPTPEAVDDMITAGGRPANECLGTVEGRGLSIYVWQAATCAVLAGCLPHYFPVVLATWDAILEPRFNLDGALTSTGGAALAAVVSGPYAEEIGMRSDSGVFGPGNRANATIGRAVRLGCMSALNAIPGQLDAGSFGHGGKYSFHFAESAPPAGWPSIREQLGFPAAATTVTVMPADAPRQIMHRWQPTPDDMLKVVGTAMRDPAHSGTGSKSWYIVVLGPEHASVLVDAGLKPRDVRAALSDISAVSISQLAEAGIKYDAPGTNYCTPDASGRMTTVIADNILVMTAGGFGAGWSMVIPCWSWALTQHPVTRLVQVPGRGVATRDPARSELDFA
jgi:hypothetical protein